MRHNREALNLASAQFQPAFHGCANRVVSFEPEVLREATESINRTRNGAPTGSVLEPAGAGHEAGAADAAAAVLLAAKVHVRTSFRLTTSMPGLAWKWIAPALPPPQSSLSAVPLVRSSTPPETQIAPIKMLMNKNS